MPSRAPGAGQTSKTPPKNQARQPSGAQWGVQPAPKGQTPLPTGGREGTETSICGVLLAPKPIPTGGPAALRGSPGRLRRPPEPNYLTFTQQLLPGRKSAFRAGLWPDCYHEKTEIGPPAGRRPAGGPRFRFSPGSSPAKIRPGSQIYGPEALLCNIEYMFLGPTVHSAPRDENPVHPVGCEAPHLLGGVSRHPSR